MKTVALLVLTLTCGKFTAQNQNNTQDQREEKAMNVTGGANRPVVAVSINKSRDRFGSEIISMVREGESVYFLSFEGAQRPEVGIWRHAMPSSVFQDVVVRLDGSNYRTIPELRMMMPGQASMTVAVTREGETEPSRFGFSLRQPELAPVMERVSTVVAELRKYPSCVLRGEAHWRQEQVKNGSAEFDVTLTNVGSQPIHISNPAREGASASSTLSLWFEIPPHGGGKSVDVLTSDIRANDGAAVTPGLDLAPGQHVSFSVRTSLSAISPGKYATQLGIRSDVIAGATREYIPGRLSVEMGILTVIE